MSNVHRKYLDDEELESDEELEDEDEAEDALFLVLGGIFPRTSCCNATALHADRPT